MHSIKTKEEQKATPQAHESARAARVLKGLLSACRTALKAGFVIIALSILIALSLEFLFSIGHIGEDTVAAPDPLLGYVHLTEQPLTYRQEGYSRSKTNSMGFREREFAAQKAPGTTRVCVLGDSMTVGMEVQPECTYTRLLEQKIATKKKNWEILNCAMSGYGCGQEYLLYRKTVQAFKPDILIVTYNVGDSEDSFYQRMGMNPPRPVFKVEHGVLKTDTTAIDKWYGSNEARFYTSCEYLRRNSRILAVLNKLNLDLQNSNPAYKTMQNVVGKPLAAIWNKALEKLPPIKPQQAPPELLQIGFSDQASYDNSDNFLPKAPIARPQANASYQELSGLFQIARAEAEVGLGIMRSLSNDCKRNNTKLVVVTAPAISNSMFYFREIDAMKKLAHKEGFTLIEAQKDFPRRDPMQESPLFFGLHFTRAGHKLMAESIYSGLEKAGMLQ